MSKLTKTFWNLEERRRGRGLKWGFQHVAQSPWKRAVELGSCLLLAGGAVFTLDACIGGASSKSPVSVSVTPSTAQVYVGITAKFTASVTGSSNTAVTWEVNGKSGGNSTLGTISSTGLYIAPSAVPSSGTVTVTAVSQADTDANASASVTILSAAVVAVSPAGATVASGATQQFQGLLDGNASSAVSWSVAGSSGATTGIGSIDSSGLYTAPLSPPATNTVVVTATSTADPSKSASANVSLVFGTGALQGQYGFCMQGQDANGTFGRVGSIVLDGEGNVTSGVEDVTNSKGTSTLLFNSGNYTVGSDGRGTLNLTNNTSGTIGFYLVLDSNTHGFLAESDSSSIASGVLRKQDSSAFSSAGLTGSYVFSFSGVDSSGYFNSLVGRFTSDGAGHVNNGQWDEDEGNSKGNIAPSGAVTFSGSSYQIDSTYGGSYGRGTASINGLDFVFYIIDSTRATFLQTDYPAVLAGDAASQRTASSSLTALSGTYVFLLSGNANNGPLARAGTFSADGGGNITNLVLVNDWKGNSQLIPSNGSLSGTYTVDANATGRGVITFADSGGTDFSLVFYQASQSQAVFEDATANVELTGSLFSQTTSSLSNSTFAGEYDFDWSGAGASNGELDGLGQVALTSATSKNASGTFDYNNAGTPEGNLTFSGTFALKGDGKSMNTLDVAATSDSSKAFSFYALVVDANTLLLVGTDGQNRSLAGEVHRQ